MTGKGQQAAKPSIAGVDYIDFTTSEANQPQTYFAGFRKLPVSWLMAPIITQVKNTPTGTGKNK